MHIYRVWVNFTGFTVDKMQKTLLYGYVFDSSVGCDNVGISGIENTHKYLIKKRNIP